MIDPRDEEIEQVELECSRLRARVDRYQEALERISMMVCRCIDDGQPCSGCTKTGREAPVVAYLALNSETT